MWNVLMWVFRLALYGYVFYLTFLKADPTMRDLMMVSGITCLDILANGWRSVNK